MIRVLLLFFLALPAWAQDQYVLVVPASSKITGVTELIAQASARPDQLMYVSSGRESALAAELFVQMTKIRLLHVPYRTDRDALADLFAGMYYFMFAPVPVAAPHVNSGKLRAFAVTGPDHAGALPKVPTMDEAGFRGFNQEFVRRTQ